MKHTSNPLSYLQTTVAAVLTLGVTMTAGYGAGTAYLGASSDRMVAILAAPAVHSASSASSARSRKSFTKKVRIGINRALIKKPRTRSSTGAVMHEAASSKAPNLPIKASCGDQLILKNLGEECDDGNAVSADGCSSTCKIEAGFSCAGMPSICYSRCGDGIVTAVEKCDDGDTDGGDGCAANCKVEMGYVCKNAPSFCEITPYCGDSIKASTEACDDGNSNHGDGCYDCKKE